MANNEYNQSKSMTPEQAIRAAILCQKLTSFKLSIVKFRYDQRSKMIYIEAIGNNKNIKILIRQSGEFKYDG
jgi:hypothetical protein